MESPEDVPVPWASMYDISPGETRDSARDLLITAFCAVRPLLAPS